MRQELGLLYDDFHARIGAGSLTQRIAYPPHSWNPLRMIVGRRHPTAFRLFAQIWRTRVMRTSNPKTRV